MMMLCLLPLSALFLALLARTASSPVERDPFASLTECAVTPNPHTQHLRIDNIAQNISQTPGVHHFNPTIIALPPWAENQYLLVSRVVTEGLHQESVLCEANICVTNTAVNRREGERDCTADSGLQGSGGGMYCATAPVIVNVPPTPAEQCDGLWSTFPDIPGFHDPRIFWSGKGEPLIIVNSASQYACLGLWITDLRTTYEPLKTLLVSQPGSHAPGPPISYSQLTELTRNPASTRAAIEKNWFLFFPTPSTAYIHYDLSPPSLPVPSSPPISKETFRDYAIPVRREAIPLEDLQPRNTTIAPGTRSAYGRTFAKVLPTGHGHTTTNLTSPLEIPCLTSSPDPLGQPGHWHQATNALKLILCRRSEVSSATGGPGSCDAGRSVHFAVMHRKFSNIWDLPLRYERYFVVWDTRPPFAMRGVSRYPVLVWNETASGWGGAKNWALEIEEEDETFREEGKKRSLMARTTPDRRDSLVVNERFYPLGNTTNATQAGNEDSWLQHDRIHERRRENWAYFTYTPSIAWAWRPQSAFAEGEDVLESLNVGYLDDEVILGIGMDDMEQAFARAKAETLLQCLRTCPGMTGEDTPGGEDSARQDAMTSFEREDETMRADTENRDFLDVWP